MKISKLKRKNVIFLIVIALLIIPQTRQPIQILLHKGLAMFGPSIINEDSRIALDTYNWKLKDLDNNKLDFKELEGNVVFVNLWATWCPPCIAEMPSIQKLHDDYKDKINFLLVSNEEQQIVKDFFIKKNYGFNSFQPITEVPELLQSSSIPRTFLIDKQGNIVIDKSGAADWNSKKVRSQIDQLLVK
jgi:thiol-disulfide isomerase/thioredoxin